MQSRILSISDFDLLTNAREKVIIIVGFSEVGYFNEINFILKIRSD